MSTPNASAQTDATPLGPLQLLRAEPRFRSLWWSQVVSELGDWFQIVALLTLLPTTGGHAHVVAGYLALRLVPMVVFMPLTGVVADRFHRGRTMIVCDVLRAAIVLSYPLVIRADGSTNVLLLYALSFSQETVTAFYEPARGATVPQLVPTRGLLAANALSGATWSAMVAAGAFLGGVVTRHLGRNVAYGINGASFVVSALFVLAARVPPLPQEAPTDRSEGASREGGVSALREGFGHLRAHPAQLGAASLKSGWGLLGGMMVLFTAFSDQVFSVRNAAAAATALGVLYAGRGIGALIGPFVARRMTGESIAGLCRALLVSFPIAAVGYFAFADAPNVWFAAGALVIAHCGGSTVWVHSTQLLQLTVPNRLLGRVFAVELALLTATMVASTLATSAVLDAGVSPRGAARMLAFTPVVVAIVWGLAQSSVRRRLEADYHSSR